MVPTPTGSRGLLLPWDGVVAVDVLILTYLRISRRQTWSN
jgi:hypothetical protein